MMSSIAVSPAVNGTGIALVTAAIGPAWMAWRSQLPFAVAGPDAGMFSILAGIAATVLCGIVFLALDAAGAGSAVRNPVLPALQR